MYQHTQKSPLHWLLFLIPAMAFGFAWLTRHQTPINMVMLVTGLLGLLVAFSFQTLTVADGGDHLIVRYGPLKLFGTQIAYRDISAVERGKSALVDGWGIRFVPFRGWTLNLYGFECVKISRGRRVIRIGTDDSGGLVRFLNTRLPQTSPAS